MILSTKALYAICAVAIFAGGMSLGWKMRAPKPGKLDPPAAAIRQSDGSLILERKLDPNAKPAQEIPKGSVVERIVYVTVKPRASGVDQLPTIGGALPVVVAPAVATPCHPVRVDLTLIRQPDQTRRVIVSSLDGDVIGGLDVPVESAPEQIRAQKWAVTGLIGYDFRNRCRAYGAMASRSAGPFVVQTGFIGQTAFVGAGVRF
jgi:hypothetical protein